MRKIAEEHIMHMLAPAIMRWNKATLRCHRVLWRDSTERIKHETHWKQEKLFTGELWCNGQMVVCVCVPYGGSPTIEISHRITTLFITYLIIILHFCVLPLVLSTWRILSYMDMVIKIQAREFYRADHLFVLLVNWCLYFFSSSSLKYFNSLAITNTQNMHIRRFVYGAVNYTVQSVLITAVMSSSKQRHA